MTAAEPTPFDQFRAVVKKWLDAYPVDIFPVPPKASTLTREQCIVRSNDSAAMGRHMATRLLQQIDELEREGLKESAEDTARLDWLSEYIGSDPVNVIHIKVNAPLMTLRSSIDGWMRAAIDAARGVKP